MSDLWILAEVETLGRLVPVRAHTLGGEFNLVLILANDLAEAKVGDLDLPIVEDDVLRLQVIVDDLLLLVVQVLEAGEDLRDDQLRLLLVDLLRLLQVVV